MLYSCGYWKNAKNLEEAQLAKLDLICKKLKLKPQECVYTDDILEYVEVAKSLGFKAFHFTDTKNFELDLKSLEIETN